MDTFKRNRKRQRQSKVSDNESSQRPPKRQRRGVSVFQRQLRKRSVWVEQYEAGKDQKRRDKRKVMRGYYKALKDLDREHRQIFGNTISTKYIKQKRNKYKNKLHPTKPNEYDHFIANKLQNSNNNNNTLSHSKKDVWNELRRHKPNWNFVNDNNDNNNNNNNNNYRNKRYRGTGVINSKNNNNNNNDNQNDNNYSNNSNKSRNSRNNRRFLGHKLLNSYDIASMEGRQIKLQKDEMQFQRELKQKERMKAIKKFEENRKKRNKILKMRNRKGQPNLNAQMTLLLDKIKSNQIKIKNNKNINYNNNFKEQQIDDNDNQQNNTNNGSDDSDIGNFLDDSD